MVPVWMNGNRGGKTVMSHAPQRGGQAPDQANSGRQTGAAVPPGQIIAKARKHTASTLTSHEQHDDNHPGDDPRQTAPRVSQHPDRRDGYWPRLLTDPRVFAQCAAARALFAYSFAAAYARLG